MIRPAPRPQGETYDFGEAYQLRLLCLVASDPQFLPAQADIIDPAYFESSACAELCRLAVEFHRRYGQGPTLEALREAAGEALSRDRRGAQREGEFRRLFSRLEALVGFPGADDVIARAAGFAKQQATMRAVEQAIELLGRGDFPRIREVFEAAFQVGEGLADDGYDWAADRERFFETRASDTVATGFAALDRLLGGGLGAGELGVIGGVLGGYKSGMLVNFGAAALRQGCDVMHFQLEGGKHAAGARYDGCLLGAVAGRGAATASALVRLQRDMAAKLSSRLFIKRYPIRSATARQLEAYLQRKILRDRVFDPQRRKLVVLVDYPMILAPERDLGAKRLEIQESYQAVLRMAQRFDARVWAPQQLNRGAANKILTDVSDAAESWGVPQDADIYLTLNDTRREHEANELRVHAAKVREAESRGIVFMGVDRAHTRAWELADQQALLARFRQNRNTWAGSRAGDGGAENRESPEDDPRREAAREHLAQRRRRREEAEGEARNGAA